MVSLDYSTAQWVLSIIVGVCLTQVYITIAHHIHYRKEIVFYVPYLLLIGQIFVQLVHLWFTSPYNYQMVEGNPLAFMIQIIINGISVIFTLLALPNEQVLSEGNLNLKEFYQDTKKNWMVTLIIWFLVMNIFVIVFVTGITGPSGNETWYSWIAIIGVPLTMKVLVLKYNNLYLHAGYHLIFTTAIMFYLLTNLSGFSG